MAWFHEDNNSTLNFMVIGHTCSGYGLVQSALNAHSRIVCHGDLLHDNVKIRKCEHEKYFGDSGKLPDWFINTHISVEQYLNNKIFDNALHDELAIGVKINYQHFMDYDIWEYTNLKYRKGDFCIVHVTRNPVACFFSHKRSEKKSKAIFIDPIELTSFVRFQEAVQKKVNGLSRDRVVIPFYEFVLNYKKVMTALYDYLEVPFENCKPLNGKVHKSEPFSRISNIAELRVVLPPDVLAYLNAPDIF